MYNEILENRRSQRPEYKPLHFTSSSQSKFTIYWKIKSSLQLLMESIFFQRIVHIYLGITSCSCTQLFDIAKHCCRQSSHKKHSCFLSFFSFFLELLQIKPGSLHPRQELYYWATVPIQRMLFYSSVIRYISTTTSPPSSHSSIPPPPSTPDPRSLHFPSGKSRPSRYFKQTWHSMMQ